MNRMQEKEQLEEISKMIESIKQIIEQNQYIHIPPFGQSKQKNCLWLGLILLVDHIKTQMVILSGQIRW